MSGKKAPTVVSIVSLLLMLMTLPPSETRGSFKCPSHLSTFFEETEEPKSGSLSKKEKKWAKIFKCASKMVSTFGRLPKLKEIEDCCKKHAKGLFKRCDKKVYQFSTCMMNKPDYFMTVIAHSGSFPVSRPPGPGFPPPGPYYGHYTTTSHLSQLYSSSGPPPPSKPPSGSSPHFFSPPPPPPYLEPSFDFPQPIHPPPPFNLTSLFNPPPPQRSITPTLPSSPPPPFSYPPPPFQHLLFSRSSLSIAPPFEVSPFHTQRDQFDQFHTSIPYREPIGHSYGYDSSMFPSDSQYSPRMSSMGHEERFSSRMFHERYYPQYKQYIDF